MELDAIGDLPMPVTYGRHLARLFEPAELLAGTGLTAVDLERPGGRLSVRQALQYVHNAIRLAPRPEWYFEWALGLSDHFHGPVSVALMSAPTLGESLDVFLKYFPDRVPYMHMQGRRDDGHFCAEICPLIDLGAARPLLIETPLLVLQQYLVSVYGVDMSAARIDLDYPATTYAERYASYFACPVRFDALRAALVIPMAWRDRPNFGYSASTWTHALQQCDATLGSSVERDTLGKVRHHLGRAFERAERERVLPTLADTAQALHLAPRTLIRRLRRMGTSYQQVIDDFLQRRACELLANEELKIKEVAGALGFTNPANFGKAFKRWYGVSPGAYRVNASRTPTTHR